MLGAAQHEKYQTGKTDGIPVPVPLKAQAEDAERETETQRGRQREGGREIGSKRAVFGKPTVSTESWPTLKAGHFALINSLVFLASS